MAADRVRSLHDVELLLARNPELDPVPLIDRVVALDIERYGRRCYGALPELEALHDAVKRQKQWVPGWLTAGSQDPRFSRLWRALRLRCACGGYLVVRKNRHNGGRYYKFAGCSTYRETDCRLTMSSAAYTVRKGLAVLSVMRGGPTDTDAHFTIVPKPKPPKRASRRFNSAPSGVQSSEPIP